MVIILIVVLAWFYFFGFQWMNAANLAA